MAEKLSESERAEVMPGLHEAGWTVSEGRDAIAKTYKFANFVEAFAWMTKAAACAEELNHHPEWSNVYKTVNVTLTTHDADGVTALDVKLAQEMDALAG